LGWGVWRVIWRWRVWSGRPFELAEPCFFGNHLLGAVLDDESEDPEKQSSKHATDGSIEN
jgi:hypothetical protein